MDSITILAIVGAVLIAVGIVVGYGKTMRLSSKLSIEVLSCKHGLSSDGSAFLLWTDYRVHNEGNINTMITGLEAHLVDAQNNLQSQTVTLSIDVAAGVSITPSKVLFSFVPPFPYDQNLKVHFVLYHKYGREVTIASSTRIDNQNGTP